jgi:acyl carrier protein
MDISWPELVSRLEQFVRQRFRVLDDDPAFTRDAHLFESGYLDSVGIIELIVFIESTFCVELDDAEIFDERFTSIHGISSVIHESLAGRVSASGAFAGATAEASQ